MTFLSNKHLLTAAIVTPILALLSYYAIGALVGEKPHVAEEGQSYQLVEKPNCRRSGGNCSLKNGDFELNLSAEWIDDDRLQLMLKSEFPLNGVLLAWVEKEVDENRPVEMRAVDEDGLIYSFEWRQPNPGHGRLRLVASSKGSLYFGDATTKFTLREPTAK